MPFQIVWFFFGSVNFGGRLSYEKKWPFVPSQGLDQAPSSGAIPQENSSPYLLNTVSIKLESGNLSFVWNFAQFFE